MTSSPFHAGVRAGLVAAAASAGAVTGLGIRRQDWSGAFVDLGNQVLLGLGANPPFALPGATGVAVHVGWMVLWGLLFALVANRRPTPTAVMMAIAIVGTAALIARWVVPAAMGAVRVALLPNVQLILCLALMCGGLLAGRALAGTEESHLSG